MDMNGTPLPFLPQLQIGRLSILEIVAQDPCSAVTHNEACYIAMADCVAGYQDGQAIGGLLQRYWFPVDAYTRHSPAPNAL
ncbi:hypothetical protein RSAG8_02800, partial [Rhizoctonia solani AG-8 WAC10335]